MYISYTESWRHGPLQIRKKAAKTTLVIFMSIQDQKLQLRVAFEFS